MVYSLETLPHISYLVESLEIIKIYIIYPYISYLVESLEIISRP